MSADRSRDNRHSRRLFLRGAALLGAALPAAGALSALDVRPASAAAVPVPASRPVAAPRAAGGTATAAVNASPTSWDLNKSDWVTWYGISSNYDVLLNLSDKDEVLPGLASSWHVSEDGMVYELKLRSGVTFHDGTPFNAAAVKFNINRIISQPTARYYEYFKHVDHVDTPDDSTVRIYMGDYQADFIYTGLAGWGSIQLSPTAYERLGDRFGSAPVGTGPFKFKSYEPDAYIEYERNDNYWGGRPLLDGLRIRIVPEANIRITELLGKTLDASYGVDAKDVQTLRDGGITVEQRVTPGANMFTFNTAKGPTQELAVRKAIARAIDRDTIIQKVLFGLAEKSRAGAPSNSPYYLADIPSVDYDPDEAGRMLDAAGWKMGSNGIREKDGQPLLLNIISTDANGWALYNQIVQEQIKAIGIDSNIESYEWGAMLDRWRDNVGEWHIGFHSQGSTVNVTSPIPASWQPDTFWNICQIKRATQPDLMQAAETLRAADKAWQATSDLTKRLEIARTVQTTYQDNQLTTWLWHTNSLVGISPRLQNYKLLYNGRVIWFPGAELG